MIFDASILALASCVSSLNVITFSSKYYEKNAIMADRVCGQLISSLLGGL